MLYSRIINALLLAFYCVLLLMIWMYVPVSTTRNFQPKSKVKFQWSIISNIEKSYFALRDVLINGNYFTVLVLKFYSGSSYGIDRQMLVSVPHL
jgi:hypothetical protein